MQKEAGPMYLIQFVLTLLQVYILDGLLIWTNAGDRSVGVAILMWLGFVVPIVAGSAMWNSDPKKVMATKFLIQAGYQLVLLIVFGFVLGMWN